jgi:hypothetical protein
MLMIPRIEITTIIFKKVLLSMETSLHISDHIGKEPHDKEVESYYYKKEQS